MSLVKEFLSLEKKYPVENIEVSNVKLWSYIRFYLGYKKDINTINTKTLNKHTLKLFLANWYYGLSFKTLFRKYDYFIFTVTSQRKLVNGKYLDRCDVIDSIINNGLYFEIPIVNHFKKSDIVSKHILSRYLFSIPEYILLILFYCHKIKGESIIKDFQNEWGVKINYRYLTAKFRAQYFIMTVLCNIYKPKLVFFSVPYTTMGFVKACKDKGVITVEFQHGVIGTEHIAYRVNKRVLSDCYPDFLLSFGKIEKRLVALPQSNYINVENVIPIGSFYIDYLNNNFTLCNSLVNLLKQYQKTICISMSEWEPYKSDAIDLVIKAALLDSEIGYVIMPRTKEVLLHYGSIKFPQNVFFYSSLNSYEIILHCDFHSTIISSMAIEALALGKQNILLNMGNKAKNMFGNTLGNEEFTKYIENEYELVNTIKTFSIKEIKYVISKNEDQIVNGFKNNLEKFILSIS